ncbi:hypothetical protein M758_8G014700 [Ceratodon purpureus]|nr:hypothetical protein M758_8G014700 [Ceratodon purpureus]
MCFRLRPICIDTNLPILKKHHAWRGVVAGASAGRWGGFGRGFRCGGSEDVCDGCAGFAMACVSTDPLAQVPGLGLVPSSSWSCSKSLAFGVQLQIILENSSNEIAPIVKFEEVAISTGKENEDVLLDMIEKNCHYGNQSRTY